MKQKIQWSPSERQLEAWGYLEDNETTELFYGGGAGGGKSYLGCSWLVYRCLRYPGTRYLMGRAVLKSLKDSTLLTFFMVCSEWGLKSGTDYKYNAMTNNVTFTNGSQIFLKDLFAYPSDPEFDSLGSTEYTGAFLDEVSQISEKAKNIVMSRLRFKLDANKIIPKLLMASNPAKNFAYRDYYKPAMENKLPKYRKFVPALVGDNPFISKYYTENLMKLDRVSKERLLYGNWEYDDDPSRLFEYEQILDIFTLAKKESNDLFISVDVARFGNDKTVIILWRDLHIENIIEDPHTSTKEVREMIDALASKHGVPRSRIVIDEDGVGGGVVDEMPGVKGFVNNARPLERKGIPDKSYQIPGKHNYQNLKAQCYFLLADYVSKAKISCYKDIDIKTKELIIEDLEQIKRKDADKDNKLAVTPKDEIKENIGRSPDYGDALMMRMYFELKVAYKPLIAV